MDADTRDAERSGLIYSTTAVQLIDQIVFGTLSTSAQARQAARYQLRQRGYDEAPDQRFQRCKAYGAPLSEVLEMPPGGFMPTAFERLKRPSRANRTDEKSQIESA